MRIKDNLSVFAGIAITCGVLATFVVAWLNMSGEYQKEVEYVHFASSSTLSSPTLTLPAAVIRPVMRPDCLGGCETSPRPVMRPDSTVDASPRAEAGDQMFLVPDDQQDIWIKRRRM